VGRNPHDQHAGSAANFAQGLWAQPENIAYGILDPLVHLVVCNCTPRVAAIPAHGVESDRCRGGFPRKLAQVEDLPPFADESRACGPAAQNIVYESIVRHDEGCEMIAFIKYCRGLSHTGVRAQRIFDGSSPLSLLRLIA
jgi:hypothetical protein